MKMIDMKLPKRSKEETKAEAMPVDKQESYPYGLQLRFENEQIKKVPALEGFNVGDNVNIRAVGTVTARRESEMQGGEPVQSIEIQIESIGIEAPKKATQMTKDELEKATRE